jgi:hypothetical protein
MQPDCSPPPAVTQNDGRQPCGGEERAGSWPLPCPQLQGCSSSVLGRTASQVGVLPSAWAGDPLLPPAFGGEGRPPALRRRRTATCCLVGVWPSVHRTGDGRAVRRSAMSMALPAPLAAPGGRTTRRTPQGGVRIPGWSCPHSRSEDGSEDLLVRARAATICWCGIGAQVAAVVGAEVVAAIGEASHCRCGCLRRRDRQCHLRPDLMLFGFNGLFSPLVGDGGEGLFTVALALGQSLLLSSRPRRRSLSLLVQWSPVNRLELVVSQPSWCGGSSFLREWSWVPFVRECNGIYLRAKCNCFKY